MAHVKPLKLRSEAVAPKKILAKGVNVADVVVDTKVFHLDEPYSYLISAQIASDIAVGSIVKVPFGRSFTEGVVISLKEGASTAGLKFIDTLISKSSVLTPGQIEFFGEISNRYGAPLWDIFRLAVPAYSKAGEKVDKTAIKVAGDSTQQVERVAITLKQGSSLTLILKELTDSPSSGKTLVIVPDEKTLDSLRELEATFMSGTAGKSVRFANYLAASRANSGLFIGLRSAIFIDLSTDDRLVVVDDSDENLYEKHMPTFNVRDLALMRAQKHSTYFISSSHSLEIERLIEIGWLTERSIGQSRRQVVTDAPEKVHGIIAEGLKKGSVLLIHANSGYVKSFTCNHCKNLALCECGERLILDRSGRGTSCPLCGKIKDTWECTFCERSIAQSLSRGVEKRAEDYARSFPHVRVLFSSGTSAVTKLPDERTLVISTPGMEPDGEYAAVLLMDGEQIFGRTGLRSDEQGQLRWTKALNKLGNNGLLYISLSSDHPVSQSIIRGSFSRMHLSEISQRASALLPPLFRLVSIEGDSSETAQVASALDEAIAQGLITTIGPLDLPRTSKSKSRLIIKFDVSLGSQIVRMIYDINRVRSLQGLKVLRVAVDPYDFI